MKYFHLYQFNIKTVFSSLSSNCLLRLLTTLNLRKKMSEARISMYEMVRQAATPTEDHLRSLGYYSAELKPIVDRMTQDIKFQDKRWPIHSSQMNTKIEDESKVNALADRLKRVQKR